VLRRIFGPDGERERERETGDGSGREGGKMRRWRMFVMRILMKGWIFEAPRTRL
jgi:hypothetical protein